MTAVKLSIIVLTAVKNKWSRMWTLTIGTDVKAWWSLTRVRYSLQVESEASSSKAQGRKCHWPAESSINYSTKPRSRARRRGRRGPLALTSFMNKQLCLLEEAGAEDVLSYIYSTFIVWSSFKGTIKKKSSVRLLQTVRAEWTCALTAASVTNHEKCTNMHQSINVTNVLVSNIIDFHTDLQMCVSVCVQGKRSDIHKTGRKAVVSLLP